MIIKKPSLKNAYSVLTMIRTYFPYVKNNIEKIKKDFTNEKNIFFIAVEKKTIAGFIHAKNQKNKIFILGLATLPEFRRKGVASRLIKKLFKYGKPLTLLVEEENSNAIRLYEKIGFKKKGYSRKTLYGKKIIKMKFNAF